MIIEVNTKEQMETFYKSLSKYRFYRRTVFQTNLKDKELQMIIKALNTKNRKERITFIYDSACEQIDSTNEKNLCRFVGNQCIAHRMQKNEKKNGCCGWCYYQSDKGCPTQNLTCKLFYCSMVKNCHKVVQREDLKILRLLNRRQQYLLRHDYFSSREEVLKDLYSVSILYATIRILIRTLERVLRYHKL